MQTGDTIVAISTATGQGALGVLRLSGPEAIGLADRIFSKQILDAPGHSLHFGRILRDGEVLDEVLLSVFRAPRSFTREDVVEISCHGSPYILRSVLQLLVDAGARPALPGEFTQRAYLHGALDLAQAEAVADLIAARSEAAHRLAMNQLRGGVSRDLQQLRQQLLDFTALIELELDFGEEDVAFADRSQLAALVASMQAHLDGLISSFRLGNALKQGVPTVILGKPNAGKSTLLNALLNENRAIVSDIPGTTRDMIEDRLMIGGIEFRLMDTAGVRETEDLIEAEGVSRSLDLARRAQVLIYLFDAAIETPALAQAYVQHLALPPDTAVVLVGNKFDQIDDPQAYEQAHDVPGLRYPWFGISARTGSHLPALKAWMVEAVEDLGSSAPEQAIISNARHLAALQQARRALDEVARGLHEGLSGDLLSIDLRSVVHHIGEITGEISNDEVLGHIFGKFCIGK
ncbi:MAG: tRNA uridine-5-carboxymethylaminomethyl(34) synthesis GTPase MnmE [Bacteroidia bacterium]